MSTFSSDVEQFTLDDALSADKTPTFSQFQALLRRLYEQWRSDLKRAALPADMQDEIDRMIGGLQEAYGIPGIPRETLAFAIELCSWAAETGKCEDHKKILMQLYNALVELDDPELDFQYYLCLIHDAIYTGDPRGVQTAYWQMPVPPNLNMNEQVFRSLTDFISSIIFMDHDRDGVGELLARTLLEMAHEKGYMARVAALYSVLAQLYIHTSRPQRCFECGQMAFAIGMVLKNTVQIANGLHYMGLSFHQTNPRRALGYLERAASMGRAAGDAMRAILARLSIGQCYFNLGQDASAIDIFQEVLPGLKDWGTYYAEAHYMLGYAQARSGSSPAQALFHLNRAERLYEALGQEYHRILAVWAQAYAYAQLKQYNGAVKLMMRVISDGMKLKDSQRESLLAEARKDLENYRRERHRADQHGDS